MYYMKDTSNYSDCRYNPSDLGKAFNQEAECAFNDILPEQKQQANDRQEALIQATYKSLGLLNTRD
jgi:hypothetical protein